MTVARRPLPTEIVEGMQELGLFGMLVPEEYGGLADDAVSYGQRFLPELATGERRSASG